MLLQTNSYIVPKERRAEHARLVQRFRHTMRRLGCDGFEVYEQVGAQWGGGETTGRFVQIMRFVDRRHQQAVQRAEQHDAAAQALIREFCDLVNMEYQRQQGLFASGYYQGVMSAPPAGTGADAPAPGKAANGGVTSAGVNGSRHAGPSSPADARAATPPPTSPAPVPAADEPPFVDPLEPADVHDAHAVDVPDYFDDADPPDSPAKPDDTAAAFALDPDADDPDEVPTPAKR